MKKTFIMQLPDKAGAFLKASRVIADAGASVTRVSYNKAVDLHVLFIEASGSAAQLDAIAAQLGAMGDLMHDRVPGQVMLIEFTLPNTPGAMLPVLELIDRYAFNITYLNADEADGAAQLHLKAGIFAADSDRMKQFLEEAAQQCTLRIVNYEKSQKLLDNTVFYLSFAHRVASLLGLGSDAVRALIADSNRLMQHLDERNELPYKTFSTIEQFATMLHGFHGSAFGAKIQRTALPSGAVLHMIAPPCGSNTYILEKNGRLLFIDCGFACYKAEMTAIFRSLFPHFDQMPRAIVLTHPDIDHCGLLDLFHTVYTSEQGAENFALEAVGRPDFREQNVLHAPYCRISKLLSGYTPPQLCTLHCIPRTQPHTDAPIAPLGRLEFEGITLRVLEGSGGHMKGEIVLVDDADGVVFSGDIVVNIRGFSKEQAAFNALAPYLMTSVNLDSARATAERLALTSLLPPEQYFYCPGHGAWMPPAAQKA